MKQSALTKATLGRLPGYLQYLQKQADLGRYQAQLKQLEQQLERANALVLESSKPSAEENTELTDGLKALDEDDIWKKKNLYD